MKKIILSAAAILLMAFGAAAQNLETATETAKMANESLMAGNNDMALSGFQEALTQALACEDSDAKTELVNTCQGIIPKIMVAMAKDLSKAGKFDEAVAQLGKATETAKKFKNADVVAEAEKLVSDTYMRKASSLVKEGNNAGAIDAFLKVKELQPKNGMVALQLGNLFMKENKMEEAVASLLDAKENGQEKQAVKILSNIYLKEAQTNLKAGKLKEAVASCITSNEYLENANAYKLAASASTKLKDNAAAINYYEKYLEVAPTAKDANGIICTLAVLYQQANNKEKAIEYYNKILTDAQYGATAKQQLEALKK